MDKNNKVKTFFRSALIKMLRFIIRRRYILFEDWNYFSDSPRKIFEELSRRRLSRKYQFVWVSANKLNLGNFPQALASNTFFVNPAIYTMRYRFYIYLTSASISCDKSICEYHHKDKITNFYISHGSPIKDSHDYYHISPAFERVICAANSMRELNARGTNFPPEKVVALGLPRNDDLFCNNLNINEMLQKNASKFVIWLPTFRCHKSDIHLQCGAKRLPLLHDKELAVELNHYLHDNDIALLVKPHQQEQDLRAFISNKYTNIILIPNDFFMKNNVSPYQFYGSCDALLTDYSSVLYDYTLCDKPIGVIWEDVEKYKKFPGFAPGIEKYLDCAHKIYSLNDMKKFLGVVLSGIDPLREIREKVKLEVNCSDKPDNTLRVVDYIIREAKL